MKGRKKTRIPVEEENEESAKKVVKEELMAKEAQPAEAGEKGDDKHWRDEAERMVNF